MNQSHKVSNSSRRMTDLNEPILIAKPRFSVVLPIVSLVLGAVITVHFLGAIEVEQLAALLTALTMLGGATAFLMGLLQHQGGIAQYHHAEKWRRREFLAREMKEFFADPTIRNALLLVDWGGRRINIDHDDKLSREHWPYIVRAQQTAALHPHTVVPRNADIAKAPTDRAEQLDQYAAFPPLAASIRDTFDSFLDRLGALEGFISGGLISAEELHPYLEYWIKDIASDQAPPEDLEWTLALFAYIDFYDFTGVTRLFDHYKIDIRPGHERWNVIEQKVKDRELVARLRRACLGG